MPINKTKVAVIGAGLVGAQVAFSIVTQGICDELVIIDLNNDLAKAHAYDLQDSVEYLSRNIHVNYGDYDECYDADIAIIAAAPPFKKGQTRLDMRDEAAKIIKSVVTSLMSSGFDGIIINITNPVDVLSHYIYKLSGFPKNRVIGTGTSLDSARLSNLIGRMIDVDPRSVHAYTMGEHGDSQMAPWSRMAVGGKPILEVMRDNEHLTGNHDPKELLSSTTVRAWEIIDGKGMTSFGIATATAAIVRAIFHNANRVMMLSALLEGEYGENDIFASVPCIINNTGIKEIVQVRLTNDETRQLKKSMDIIRHNTLREFVVI